ncbi:FtsB family cell division protein [Spirochaeta cellobiosiphila]|uniref:FtsB family cell division protein n=1 Tax=Spirochaeta cellobiosiphila TaxID=504483 RepID=UPI0004902D09|nr:septum formation initiator family protein [Spirochaeta cellobiosiphila]
MKQGIIISLYLSVSLYFFLIFLFGPLGRQEEKDLSAYKLELQANIEDLERQNKQLLNKIELLKTSKESIRLLAREMGFYDKDEKVIVINGLGKTSHEYNPGQVILFDDKQGYSGLYFRLMCLTIFLILTLVIVALRETWRSSHRTPTS